MRGSRVISVVALLVLLAGCSARPEKADTVNAPQVTSTATEAATTPAPVIDAKSLTQEQIDAALLVQADMPAGWTQEATTDDTADDTESDATEGGLTYEPAECKAVVEGLSSGEDEIPADAHGEAGFSNPDYQFIKQEIASGVGQMDVAKLNTLTDALSACPSYTTTDAEGTVSQYTISALDMPNFGDRTMAVRVAAGSDPDAAFSLTLTLDVVMVSAGNVAVTLVTGGFEPLDPAVTQQVASTAMAKVNAAD